MNKHDLIQKIKALDGISQDERAYLIDLVNTKKKYGLVWEDKPEAVEEQLRENLPVLREVVERRILGKELPKKEVTISTLFSNQENQTNPKNQGSVNYPNHILIEGDNLHALTALTFTHENKVDVIYIDPPYNTGNKDKKGKTDFKYNDNYITKEDTFRHSMWLSFINKRLKIAKNLLSSNGFIAISIDDNEYSQLKMLLDDLFNQNVKSICIKMSEASGLKMSSVKKIGTIPKYKEYLLLAKLNSPNGFFFENIKKDNWDSEYNIFLENLSQEDRLIIDDFTSFEEEVTDEQIAYLDKIVEKVNLLSVSEVMQSLGLSKKTDKDNWCFENAWRICQCASSSSVLSLADEKRVSNKNLLFFVKSVRDKNLYLVRSNYSKESSKPRVQMIFADSNLTYHPGDLWTDIKTTGLDAEGGIKFKNGKKPIKLLNRVLNSNKKSDSIILDFFAGSGSTLHSVLDLNKSDKGTRQCILVTSDENNICEEITYQRILNIKDIYPENNFRYFKTDFVKSQKSQENKRQLTALSTLLLCIKEDCYTELTAQFVLNENQAKIFTNNQGKYLVVVYYSRQQLQVYEQLIEIIQGLSDATEKIKLYAFSPEKETLVEDFIEVADKIDAIPLPDAIYNAYRATFRAIKLDKKAPVSFQSTENELPESETEETQN